MHWSGNAGMRGIDSHGILLIVIQYLSGWTYVSKKRGVRITLMSNDGNRVRYCNNNYRSAFVIAETSLSNFMRWTDERKTLQLHRQVAFAVAKNKFIRRANAEYAFNLIASAL